MSDVLEATQTAGPPKEIPCAPPAAATDPQLPDSIMRIPVIVQVVLGSVRMPIGKVAELKAGATVTLDQKLGAPVSILINGREVAKGDLFVLDGEDERLGVTITDLSSAG